MTDESKEVGDEDVDAFLDREFPSTVMACVFVDRECLRERCMGWDVEKKRIRGKS